MDIQQMTDIVRRFAQDREWEQFHTPKNLVLAVAGEVGELAELFQWLTPDEAALIMTRPDTAEAVRHELADVLGYILRLADVLNVDLAKALVDKVAINEARYPVEAARGNARKYTDFLQEGK